MSCITEQIKALERFFFARPKWHFYNAICGPFFPQIPIGIPEYLEKVA